MRGLAAFIMRGRWQALAVAVLGASSMLFGWLSAAAVALVTLRKGPSEGTWLVLWAALPALLVAYVSGDASTLLLLIGTYLLALVLRVSVSMALVALTSALVGLASGAGLLVFSPDFLAQLVELFTQVLDQLEASWQETGAGAPAFPRPTVVQVAGILAAGNAAMSMLSVLLGRWWQATLYNPGGFGSEFRSLRLPPVWTGVLALAAAGLWMSSPLLVGWAAVVMVPLTFCGLALVHNWAAVKGYGSGWLTAFYVVWVVFDPSKALLVGLVVIDALFDFRSRWASGGSNGST